MISLPHAIFLVHTLFSPSVAYTCYLIVNNISLLVIIALTSSSSAFSLRDTLIGFLLEEEFKNRSHDFSPEPFAPGVSFSHPLNGSPAAPGDQPKRVLNHLSDIDIFNGGNEWWRSRKYPIVVLLPNSWPFLLPLLTFFYFLFSALSSPPHSSTAQPCAPPRVPEGVNIY